MMNTLLLLIIIGVIIFSVYNKKIVCRNNVLFMILFIVLSYCVIIKGNILETFKDQEECNRNCENKNIYDKYCPDKLTITEKELKLTFNTINTKEDGTTSKRCLIKNDILHNKISDFETKDWSNNKSSGRKIKSSSSGPVGWGWNLNNPDGFQEINECKSICKNSINKPFKLDLLSKPSSSDKNHFVENGYYYFGSEPTDKALNYCKIKWTSDTDNDIMNNKRLSKNEKKQRLILFIECILSQCPRPNRNETKKLNEWVKLYGEEEEKRKGNIKDYAKWIDEMKKKMSNNQCYKPSENIEWCGPGSSPSNPNDNYKGLTDVLTCQKNSKKWLNNSGDICLQSFMEGKRCSEYPDNAKNHWKNKKITDSNELRLLFNKMEQNIISKIQNTPSKPPSTKPPSKKPPSTDKKDNKPSLSLGSSMADNLLSDFFGIFKDNKIHDKDTFNKEINKLRNKNKNKIDNTDLWNWYNKH